MARPSERSLTTLIAAGVPLGASPAARPACSVPAVRRALAEALDADLDEQEREAIAAWLGAMRRHFPETYAEVVDVARRSDVEALVGSVCPSRYLKLRRIAIATLASHRLAAASPV